MGKLIYNREVEIEVVKEEMIFDMHVVTFNLTFENSAFTNLMTLDRDDQRLPLRASTFIEIFPFCILFGYTRRFVYIYILHDKDLLTDCLTCDSVYIVCSPLCLFLHSVRGAVSHMYCK